MILPTFSVSVLIFVSFAETAVIRVPEFQLFCPDHPNEYAINCPYHQQRIVDLTQQQFVAYPYHQQQHRNCPHHHHRQHDMICPYHTEQQSIICPHHQNQGIICPYHHQQQQQQQQQPIMYPQYEQLQPVFYPQFQQQEAVICQHVQIPGVVCPFHQTAQSNYPTTSNDMEVNNNDRNSNVEEIPAYIIEVAEDENEMKNDIKPTDQNTGVEVILIENPEANNEQDPEQNNVEIHNEDKNEDVEKNKEPVRVMIYQNPQESEFQEPIYENKIQQQDKK